MRWNALLILILCITPSLATADSLDWLLDCRAKEGFDYYAELDKLKKDSVPRPQIVAAIRRELPQQFIGRNSECIYDVIIFFSDDSIVAQLSERQRQPNRADEPGYVEDLISLLETRSRRYADQTAFTKELSRYRHHISIQHFLEIHLSDMPTRAQLAAILSVIQDNKLPGVYHYAVPLYLEKIYAASPIEYDKFVSSLSKAPLEFTCFKDNSCP